MEFYLKKRGDAYYYLILFIFVMVPVVAAVIYVLTPYQDLNWKNLTLHTAVEMLGAVVAIVMTMILIRREEIKETKSFLPVAIGLSCMGVLKGFHSSFHVGNEFVFLNAIASFVAAIAFAFLWVPKINDWIRKNSWLFSLSVFVGFSIGFFAIMFPQELPLMIVNGVYTKFAVRMHLFSGVLFLFAALRVTIDFQKTNRFECFLLLCLSLLFCVAELVFNYSKIWNIQWWFWHGLQLVAFLVMLRFVIGDYQYLVYQLNKALVEQQKAEKEMRAATELKSKFISVASHELRTPLTTIKEAVNIVIDGVLGDVSEKQKHVLNITKSNIGRLARLVDDVLDFQKLEAGKMPFVFSRNNINEIISDVYTTMHSLVKQKGLFFEMSLENDLPKIHCDRDKIIQVLANLINNAAKFVTNGGIHISTKLGSNAICVAVRDTGIGIKKEDMPRLFHTFEQLEKTEMNHVKGTGLGLAICKEIIEGHKGKIWVESVYGSGSTFRFVLPIKERRRR